VDGAADADTGIDPIDGEGDSERRTLAPFGGTENVPRIRVTPTKPRMPKLSSNRITPPIKRACRLVAALPTCPPYYGVRFASSKNIVGAIVYARAMKEGSRKAALFSLETLTATC
jgi:hypothetical protein